MLPAGKKQISPARRIALEVLRRVEAEGAFSHLALNHALQRSPGLNPADRALATELVYGTLRWSRRLDYALAAHCHRPLERIEPGLLRVLRMTAYQLLFLDGVPEWAAVDQGAELARRLRGRRAAGFVNGVLRALARGQRNIDWPDADGDLVRHLAVRHSFPDWLVEYWLEELGSEQCRRLLEALNRPASAWLRPNTLRIVPAGLADLLSASGLQVQQQAEIPGALKCQRAGDLAGSAAHQTGLFHLQDGAAQLVCQLLDPRPGQRLLDACSAPGGKTATLAELLEDRGELFAVDVNPARLALVRGLTERLGIGCVKFFVHDMSQPAPHGWGSFDRVLLDAPCSSLGVIRRHPEVKWRVAAGDAEHLSRQQLALLDNCAGLVKPDGLLVYSVCSLDRREGSEVVEKFLQRHPEFELVDPRGSGPRPWYRFVQPRGWLMTWPQEFDCDGFFAARLRRRNQEAG